MANKPIFFDATGRRAAGVSIAGWIVALVSLLLGAAFIASLVIVDTNVQGLILPGRLTAIRMPDLAKKALAPEFLRQAQRLALEARLRRTEIARANRARMEKSARSRLARAAILRPQKGRPLSIGFYPSWQPSAFDSLQHALPRLDWVVPTWLSLQGPRLDLKNSYSDRVYNYVGATKPTTAILPVVQNPMLGKWERNGLANVAE